MKNKCAFFWDWNGTVVDDAFLFVNIMNDFLKEQSLSPINIKKYRDCFQFPLFKYYSALGFDFKKESFEMLAKRFIKIYTQRRFEAGLFQNISEIFILLKHSGFLQAVVSAQENSLLSSAVSHYNLAVFFDAFAGVDNIYANEKIALALKIKKTYFVDCNKFFVIGDSLLDLELAKKVGATPILVSYGHYAKNRLLNKNCIVVDSVFDLKRYLINNVIAVN